MNVPFNEYSTRLEVVLLAMDAPAHAVGMAVEPGALATCHDPIRLCDTLMAVNTDLTAHQASCLGSRQFAGPDTLRDAFTLILLTRIEPGRVRKGRHGHGGQHDHEGEFPEHIESPFPIAHDLWRSVKGTGDPATG